MSHRIARSRHCNSTTKIETIQTRIYPLPHRSETVAVDHNDLDADQERAVTRKRCMIDDTKHVTPSSYSDELRE